MKKAILWLAAIVLLCGASASAQTVYYNTEGGRYYHADPHCDSISEKYWSSMSEIKREQAQQIGLKGPCERCVEKEAASIADEAGGPEVPILNAPVTLEYSPEDQVFYEACFENARQNMHDPARSDPEYVYRNQAQYCEEQGEGGRKYFAKQNMLWGLASESDIPRDRSLLIGYTVLEKIVQMPREEMNKYFADAWLNISNPDQRIWQVHMNMASDYRRVQPDAVSYIMYVDAGTGEVLDVMKY